MFPPAPGPLRPAPVRRGVRWGWSRWCRHLACGVLAALLPWGPLPGAEQAPVRRYSQPAQDLPAALEVFSRTTGLDVIARGDLLAGKKSAPLAGEYAPEEALQRLLEGTGLIGRPAGEGMVVVVPVGLEAGGASDLYPGGSIHEVVVVGDAVQGYRAETATTATRLPVPLRDLPQTVNVVPGQLLADRGILRPAELADSVAGVQALTGYGGIPSGDFFIRGFGTNTTLRNGFKDFSFLSPVDFAGIERVEFLKGPSSVLYGQGQPGGVANYLSKRPGPERVRELTAIAGSEGLYRTTLDVGDAAWPARGTGEQPTWMYRWNSAREEAGSHRDHGGSESLYLAPAVTWQISPDTSLTLTGEYHQYDYVFDRGLPAVPQALRVPSSRFLGEPENMAETDAWRGGYEWLHRVNDRWNFRSGFAAIISSQESWFAQPYAIAGDGRTVLRHATARRERSVNYTWQNEVAGNFDTGGVRHEVLGGVELARYEFRYEIGFREMAAIDFFHPVYGAGLPHVPYDPLDGYGADTVGVYLQDLLTLTPRWKVLLGLRHDAARTEEVLSRVRHEDAAWSPRLGLVYQPSSTVSWYAGWSASFNPNFGINRDGVAFAPEEGEQLEAGVKLALLEDRLTATLSVYEITKGNVLVPDPAYPGYSITAGRQRSRGAEVELVGEPVQGCQLILNYTYADAIISEDTAIPPGTALAGVPEHALGAWATYEWQHGPCKGLGVGTGVSFTGVRPANVAEEAVMLPSAWCWDVMIYYKRAGWQAQVNFKNLTSARLYQSQGALIYPEAPLQVQAGITWRW